MSSEDLVRVPRAMSEAFIQEFCTEVPETLDWVVRDTLPGEHDPRRLLTQRGLARFRQWLAAPPAPPPAMQQVSLLHLVSLSYEAGLVTDPTVCKQLCRPYRAEDEV